MLEEAVEVIRALWTGEITSHHGRHFTVENARISRCPTSLPPIHVAGSGPRMAAMAGRIGDGFIGTGPEKAVVDAYRKAGGEGPRFGQVTVCWAETEAEARRTALRVVADGRAPRQRDAGAGPAAGLRGPRLHSWTRTASPSRSLRPGAAADPGCHRRIRRRRLRPRVPPPGRARPGGLPRLRRAMLLPAFDREPASLAS